MDFPAELNASNGCLMASIARDDEQLAQQLATEVQCSRSASTDPPLPRRQGRAVRRPRRLLERAFVGGELLVHAATQGSPNEDLYGNFPDYHRYPPV